ncbi:Uncharacterised protein [Amycolatopsis camponoti]|uniref:DUF6292 domain-containing protein n=1 Tax=Amycolatopsis camponoti TaxID=2606593 RepID=A0A6I8MBK2_9PSEU|nr:DUF6292 family protein [Amycolatopsis camponoti]VVJ25110.1 Uncharacterised protein [Amycolatopsis camponoti]
MEGEIEDILIGFGRDTEYHFARGLRAYVGRVARAVGVGFESCSLDPHVPASGYVALEGPGRDLALIWHEVHGWSAVAEPADGVPQVLAYLGGTDVVPPPHAVARFAARLPAVGSSRPPVFRAPGRHEDLVGLLPVTGPEGLLRASSPPW